MWRKFAPKTTNFPIFASSRDIVLPDKIASFLETLIISGFFQVPPFPKFDTKKSTMSEGKAIYPHLGQNVYPLHFLNVLSFLKYLCPFFSQIFS